MRSTFDFHFSFFFFFQRPSFKPELILPCLARALRLPFEDVHGEVVGATLSLVHSIGASLKPPAWDCIMDIVQVGNGERLERLPLRGHGPKMDSNVWRRGLWKCLQHGV